MRHRILHFLLVQLVVSGFSPYLFPQSHLLTTYTTAHGLPQNVVFDLHQDQLGFLWICTIGGAVRFDGTEFTAPHVPDLTNQRVWCVYEQNNGDLWFGAKNGVVNLQRRNGIVRDTVFTRENNVLFPIRHIAGLDGDRIWFLGEGGILEKARMGDSFVDITAQLGLPRSLYFTAVESVHGDIWIGSANGLYRVDKRIPSRAVEVSIAGNPVVRGLLADGNMLWIATQDGRLLKYDLRKNRVENVSIPSHIKSCYSVIRDAEGSLWLATYNGVLQIKGEPTGTPEIEIIDERSGLNNEIVLPLIQDHQGNMWMGTHDGLVRMSKARAQRLTVENGLSANTIVSTVVDSIGRLWIGSSAGLDVYDIVHHRKVAGFVDERQSGVVAMCATSRAVYAGNEDGLRIYEYTPTRIFAGNRLLKTPVLSVAVKNDAILVGGRDRLTIMDGNRRFIIDSVNNESIQGVFSITTAADGQIYIGTNRGALRGGFADHHIELTKWNDVPFQSTAVGHVFEDPHSRLWISTENRGIFVVERKTVFHLDISTGLADNIVNMVCQVDSNRLWAATNRGISIFDIARKQLLGTYATELLTGQGGAVKAITRNNDRIFLSTSDGVVIVSDDFQMRDSIPLHIGDLRINGEPIADQYLFTEQQMKLPPDVTEIEFNLLAITMMEGRNVRYSYRLRGFADKWTRPLADKRVRYTGLGPGMYQLEAQVVFPDGSIGGRVSRAIIIETPFWMTYWFGGLVVLVLVGLLYGGHQWRLRRLQIKTAELERLVEQRTAEVRSQSETLAAQKSALEETLRTLQETQSQLIQAEKMSSLGRMVAGVAHEINNPLTFIHGNIPILRKAYARVEAVLADKEKAAEVNDVLDACERGAVRIAEIVKRLRNFSRLDQSDLEHMDICAGVDHACEMVNYQYPGMEMIKDYRARPVLMAAARDLQQVFYNVLLNAAESYIDSDPKAWILVTEESGNIVIRIEDHGRGINSKNMSKIFDPFFTTKAIGKGAGLGLTLAYNVVAAHGGSIGLAENAGGGTTCTLILPSQS